ncbi:hypothetical protein AJ80_01503 [Polytolypa hystricis UAMH7299]|uniref:Uncharacterized protein n=1 Tax=Polytolypa hystricis (strain UAMH7299) TaxID=1447883 RepID=A0A2B7Z0H4_POLH7|nr:hypothetical protein AJ80_01503 [Polytolypa hystricis UAMH7299]
MAGNQFPNCRSPGCDGDTDCSESESEDFIFQTPRSRFMTMQSNHSSQDGSSELYDSWDRPTWRPLRTSNSSSASLLSNILVPDPCPLGDFQDSDSSTDSDNSMNCPIASRRRHGEYFHRPPVLYRDGLCAGYKGHYPCQDTIKNELGARYSPETNERLCKASANDAVSRQPYDSILNPSVKKDLGPFSTMDYAIDTAYHRQLNEMASAWSRRPLIVAMASDDKPSQMAQLSQTVESEPPYTDKPLNPSVLPLQPPQIPKAPNDPLFSEPVSDEPSQPRGDYFGDLGHIKVEAGNASYIPDPKPLAQSNRDSSPQRRSAISKGKQPASSQEPEPPQLESQNPHRDGPPAQSDSDYSPPRSSAISKGKRPVFSQEPEPHQDKSPAQSVVTTNPYPSPPIQFADFNLFSASGAALAGPSSSRDIGRLPRGSGLARTPLSLAESPPILETVPEKNSIVEDRPLFSASDIVPGYTNMLAQTYRHKTVKIEHTLEVPDPTPYYNGSDSLSHYPDIRGPFLANSMDKQYAFVPGSRALYVGDTIVKDEDMESEVWRPKYAGELFVILRIYKDTWASCIKLSCITGPIPALTTLITGQNTAEIAEKAYAMKQENIRLVALREHVKFLPLCSLALDFNFAHYCEKNLAPLKHGMGNRTLGFLAKAPERKESLVASRECGAIYISCDIFQQCRRYITQESELLSCMNGIVDPNIGHSTDQVIGDISSRCEINNEEDDPAYPSFPYRPQPVRVTPAEDSTPPKSLGWSRSIKERFRGKQRRSGLQESEPETNIPATDAPPRNAPGPDAEIQEVPPINPPASDPQATTMPARNTTLEKPTANTPADPEEGPAPAPNSGSMTRSIKTSCRKIFRFKSTD